MLGTAVQTGANHNIACIYGKFPGHSAIRSKFEADNSAGRFVGGLGIGAISMLVPMYNAELAPPGIRGSLVALQQLAITCAFIDTCRTEQY